PAAPARVGGTETRFHHHHAFHAVAARDRHRLAVEQEADAFLAAVLELAARAGHVLGVAPVRAGDARRALPDRGAVAVHAGVAAAEHHDMLAGEIDPGPLLAVHAELAVHVGDQVGQRLVNAWQ